MTSLLKLELTVCFVAFIASSSRVTEEDCFSETNLSDPTSFFKMLSLLLKELIFSSPVQSTGRAIVVTLASTLALTLALAFLSRHF